MPSWIWITILVWHALASALSASLYAIDKRRAIRGGWRIPEKRLHLIDLLGGWPGGWPGGWIARRKLRHKTSKATFVFVFWATAGLHVGVAVILVWLTHL